MSAAVVLLGWGIAVAQEPVRPCPEVDLDVAADDAVRALTDDELSYAWDVATSALGQVDCVPRVVDPQDLATLYQARAGARFYAVPPQDHQSDLVQSAVVLPGWFNDRLGPDLRQAWERAATGLSGQAQLRVWPIPDDGVLYIDGQARDTQPAGVLPGQHLVQVAVGAEVGWAWSGALADGQDLTLETGLPEPTTARLVRDNPLLVSGLALALGVGSGAYPVYRYGDRFKVGLDGSTFYSDSQAYPDPVITLERDWKRYQAMRGLGLMGSVAATGLISAHVLGRLRARMAS